MSEINCKLSPRMDVTLYLGVRRYYGEWGLCVTRDDHGTVWTIRDIPFSRSRYLVKKDGDAAGSFVTWAGGFRGVLMASPQQVGWNEQVIILDDVEGGFVAVNNHDRDRVMDVSEDPSQSPMVISFPWNSGNNQQWLIRPE